MEFYEIENHKDCGVSIWVKEAEDDWEYGINAILSELYE